MKKHKKQTKKYLKISPTVQLALALILFVAAVLASRGKDIAAWEASLFQMVYGWPDSLFPVFIVITQMGSILMLGALAGLYLLKRKYHILLRLLMSGLLAYLAAGFAKDIWGRGRPSELLLDIVSLDFIVRGPGFPSGHVALATALAFVIGHYLPRKYHWLPVVWIVGVGLSRMYLGVHVPLDIVGGFAIGWASYALFRHVRLYDVKFGHHQKHKI